MRWLNKNILISSTQRAQDSPGKEIRRFSLGFNEKKKIVNLNIPDGEYREIDLSQAPFLLSEPYQKILDKDELNKQSGFYCYLNLYSKKQINNLVSR